MDPSELDARFADLPPPERTQLARPWPGYDGVGYGLNRGETEMGIAAVGVAVLDYAGQAMAAVSVPATRRPQARVPEPRLG